MFLLEAFGWATIVAFVISIVARFIPNEKLEKMGFDAGVFITNLGSSKLGPKVWENIENFFIQAFASFLEGLHRGLRIDDLNGGKTEEKDTKIEKESKTGNVRT